MGGMVKGSLRSFTTKHTGTYSTSVVDHDVNLSLLAEDLLNDVLYVLVTGHVQSKLMDVRMAEVSHLFNFARRCIHYASFISEFFCPEIMLVS